MKTSFLYKQKWNTRCTFIRKIKKKCYLCTFCSKIFFILKWFGISLGFTVYIIRGTLHDCLEKGNFNSNVILTPSAAKKCFIVKRFGISLGFTVFTIRRTLQDFSSLLFSSWKKYFPCSLHSLVEHSYNTQRQILHLGPAM